jgi:hypothetical protein
MEIFINVSKSGMNQKFTTNSLECVKLYLKQEYFEKVSEFKHTVFDCGKYRNCINYMLFPQK